MWIFRSFMGIFTIFLNPVFWPRTVPDRLWRSTDRSTGPRVGRPIGRPTCTDLCTLGWHLGRSTGPESSALCFWAVDLLPPTVEKSTIGGRPGGRPPAVSGWENSQRLVFCFGLYKPHFFGILAKAFTREKFQFSLVFKISFQKCLKLKRFHLCFVFKGFGKFKEK